MSEIAQSATAALDDTRGFPGGPKVPARAVSAGRAVPTGLPPDTPTEIVCAGFIVWLAWQRVPPGRRKVYHRAVEEYLHWHDDHPGGTEDSACGYYAQLRAGGASDATLSATREALAWLGTYLSSAPAELAQLAYSWQRRHRIRKP